MDEKILFKIEEGGIVYYMIKNKESKLPIRISRDELIKRNRALVEKYEQNSSVPFLNKKRKISGANIEDTSKDNSSEETQHIHRYNIINKEKNFIQKQNKNLLDNTKKIIQNKASTTNNNKESIIPNNNNSKKLTSNYKIKERDGRISIDIPSKIINVGYNNFSEKKLCCWVQWKQQENIRILDSYVEYDRVRKKCPYLLLDFFESKIIFLDGD